MKTFQNTKFAVILTVSTCISALPYANGQDEKAQPPAAPASPAAKQSDGQLSAADAKFVREAAKGSQMEIKMGQLGQQKAQNETVKQLADALVNDHTRSSQELNQLAGRKGLTLPAEYTGAQGGTSARATGGQSSTAGAAPSQPASADRSDASDSASKSAAAQGGTSPAARAGTSTDRAASGYGQGGDSLQSLRNLSGSDFDRAFVEHAIKDHQKQIASYERASTESQDADVKAFAEKTLTTLRTHLQMAQVAAPSDATTPQK